MKELILKAVVDNLPQVTAFIDEQLEALDCPLPTQMKIDIAIDELFCNIAHYAYAPDTGDATVRFDWDEAAREVAITFMDSGVPFNPLEKADPDVSLSAQERQLGGLGIFLVKKSMDRMEYRREDGFNILTIRKAL